MECGRIVKYTKISHLVKKWKPGRIFMWFYKRVKKVIFHQYLKKKKILPLPYPEVWGESCQVMIEVLLSTGVSGQRDVSFCSRSVSCGFVTLAK